MSFAKRGIGLGPTNFVLKDSFVTIGTKMRSSLSAKGPEVVSGKSRQSGFYRTTASLTLRDSQVFGDRICCSSSDGHNKLQDIC